MKRIFALCITVLLLAAAFTVPAGATDIEQVYDTYIYGNKTDIGDGDPIEIPAVFSVEKVYDSLSLGAGNLLDISDIFFDGSRFFICDTGNNRLVVFDKDFKFIRELKTFKNDGKDDTFSSPTGCFSNSESLVVCDSVNSRILVFSLSDYSVEKVLSKPHIGALEDENGEYIYTPKKAVMDNAGRFYVIADGINQGLIRLDSNGEFITFIGAPSVVPNFAELVWRKFATKEQKNSLNSLFLQNTIHY
ncbi:MAG: hypothetical protein IKK24_04745 [Clostridia bacterium]|nr:hypothetical protein [Clostridia bacterium]